MNQLNLFESDIKCQCERYGAALKANPVAGSKAKMLKRSKSPKGLCVNCAVHNWMRNTYPVNLLLAQSGPRGLALPHIQEQFAGIMKSRCSDAVPDEIGWQAIIDNWDLPFPTKLKSSPMNPVDQAELDRATKEGVPIHSPGYPLSPEEQIEEQRKGSVKLLKKIFPGSEITIE